MFEEGLVWKQPTIWDTLGRVRGKTQEPTGGRANYIYYLYQHSGKDIFWIRTKIVAEKGTIPLIPRNKNSEQYPHEFAKGYP